MTSKCPVCGKPLVAVYTSYMDHIVCEYEDKCEDGHFYDIFAYGYTEVAVRDPRGEWQTWYLGYTDSSETHKKNEREMKEFIASFTSGPTSADKGGYEGLCESNSSDAPAASKEPRQNERGIQPAVEDNGLFGKHQG